ncbi:MAG: Ig-like domain-containing protein [Bacillota bacterium]|nr:Ig-like domain-containing protein [Bacillota bacterium]
MKRISALVCMILIAVAMCVPASFAANDVQSTDVKNNLTIVQTSPEDGTEGVAVDNFSVKIYFNKAVKPENKQIKKANAKQFVLKNEKGVKIPIKVYYSGDEEGLIMVAADVVSADRDHQIKGDQKYTLTVKRGFTASDGSTMIGQETVTLKTLNQSRSMVIYMLLMVLMMGGMVFFTMRSTKKEAEKEKEEKKKQQHVNPYKEAKKTGKSVQEIVEKDNKKKQKRAEAEAKAREAEAAIEAEIMEKIRRESNKRVAGPRPISAAGSTYKVTVVKDSGKKVEEPKESKAKNSKGTTNPKGQSGKKKNSKKKKGKK